ncbi:MAG: RHS repeat-associated core domain-containing protein, partial [Nitrospiria bacterium]
SPFGDPGTWRLAGLATVSADGTKIVSDPGVGIERFCAVCGIIGCISTAQAAQAKQPNITPGGETGGDPFDLATGIYSLSETDLVLPGRTPVIVNRSYNPFDPFRALALFGSGLGRGWYLSFDVTLLSPNAELVRLILPGNSRLDLVRQSGVTFTNSTHPSLKGAVLKTLPEGGHQLRFKDETTWRFKSFEVQSGTSLEFLVEIADRIGNKITIERGDKGKVSRIVDSVGRALEFTYSFSGGVLTQIRDPLGRTIQYGYDNNERLARVTDHAGGVKRYDYDSDGRVVSITDPKGITFLQNSYGPSGRVLRQVQADGGEWRYHYRMVGATVTGPGCPGTSCPTEDSLENLQAGFSIKGGTVTSTVVVDPRGNISTHRFNNAGLVIEQINALGQKAVFTRDANNKLLATTDSLGRATRFEYDVQGNVTKITDPSGNVRTFTYEPVFNKVATITDPLGSVTRYEYDEKGYLVSSTDPLGNIVRFAYDAFGQLVTLTDPLGTQTLFGYTPQGELATITDPLGNVSTREYDLISRLVRATGPRGKATTFTYDLLNRLLSSVDQLGGTTAFSYDHNGNILKVTDARGNPITFEYDQVDRLVRRQDPIGVVETLRYDLNGNLVETEDRKGQRTTVVYDALDRPVRSVMADGTVVVRTYDSAGRLVQIDDSSDPHRPIQFEYDVLDRLVGETTALGTVTYQYDALGRRTQMIVNGLVPVIYSYDPNSRLRTITQPPLNPINIEYDALGQRTLLRLPNGVSTEYQYDSASNLTELIYRNDSGVQGNLTYQYDPSGNTIAIGGSFSRTLLPSSVGLASYDAANRQLAFGDKEMTYDANGNLISMTDASSRTTFVWDGRERLVAINGRDFVAAFAYDGLGRRVVKRINSNTTFYQYDGFDMVREGSGIVETKHIHGSGIDEPLVRLETESTGSFVSNAQGSPIEILGESGQIVTSYSYGPFGETNVIGSPSANPFQFTGRESDETGFYFLRARYYSPALSRFISPDSVQTNPLHSQGWNRYLYARNNPLKYIDSTGRFPTYGRIKIHQEAIWRQLGKFVNEDELEVLFQGQQLIDHPLLGGWSRSQAYKHAMRAAPHQTCEGAKAAANDWVRDNLQKARAADKSGFRLRAMGFLSNAMHTLGDSTSPMHHGFQPYDGVRIIEANPLGEGIHSEDVADLLVGAHVKGEAFDPGPGSKLDQVTLDAWRYFTGELPLPPDFDFFRGQCKNGPP